MGCRHSESHSCDHIICALFHTYETDRKQKVFPSRCCWSQDSPLWVVWLGICHAGGSRRHIMNWSTEKGNRRSTARRERGTHHPSLNGVVAAAETGQIEEQDILNKSMRCLVR